MWKSIDKSFLDLQLESNASTVFLKVTKDVPYGLNVMLAKELCMSEAGFVLGYSPHFPGPSSSLGVKRSGVFLKVPMVPKLTDSDFVHFWTLEIGNLLAHEIGHYLGLSHTNEKGMETIFDNIADTPTYDTGNMMDPVLVRTQKARLTIEQARELNSHPIVTTEP
jgi:hypothetical protein